MISSAKDASSRSARAVWSRAKSLRVSSTLDCNRRSSIIARYRVTLTNPPCTF